MFSVPIHERHREVCLHGWLIPLHHNRFRGIQVITRVHVIMVAIPHSPECVKSQSLRAWWSEFVPWNASQMPFPYVAAPVTVRVQDVRDARHIGSNCDVVHYRTVGRWPEAGQHCPSGGRAHRRIGIRARETASSRSHGVETRCGYVRVTCATHRLSPHFIAEYHNYIGGHHRSPPSSQTRGKSFFIQRAYRRICRLDVFERHAECTALAFADFQQLDVHDVDLFACKSRRHAGKLPRPILAAHKHIAQRRKKPFRISGD